MVGAMPSSRLHQNNKVAVFINEGRLISQLLALGIEPKTSPVAGLWLLKNAGGRSRQASAGVTSVMLGDLATVQMNDHIVLRAAGLARDFARSHANADCEHPKP